MSATWFWGIDASFSRTPSGESAEIWNYPQELGMFLYEVKMAKIIIEQSCVAGRRACLAAVFTFFHHHPLFSFCFLTIRLHSPLFTPSSLHRFLPPPSSVSSEHRPRTLFYTPRDISRLRTISSTYYPFNDATTL